MISNLHNAIAAVCPIHGVSIGSESEPSTWAIDFRDDASPAQRAAAAQVLAAFDPTTPTHAMIDAERDRRIVETFRFGSVAYQLDADSQVNIASAFSLAMASGGAAGNLRWLDPDADFAWIASDNTLHPMDAPTVIAFGYAAAAWKSMHITAARALKNNATPPVDYASAAYWPSA